MEEMGSIMSTTEDWRDLDGGPLIPSARHMAFLDWVKAARPAVVELLYALPAGVRSDDMTHPAVRAWWERMEQAYGEWDAAGQPDPSGAMNESQREWRIRAHENAVGETSASTYH